MTNFFLLSVLILCSSFVRADDIDSHLDTKTTQYDNNLPIDITLHVVNTQDVAIENIHIVTDWLLIEASTDRGGLVKVFKSMHVTASLDEGGQKQQSNAGTFNNDADLNITDARIAPKGKLTYRIKAIVNNEVRSRIQLTALVNDKSTNAVGLNRVPYDYALTKRVVNPEYQPGQDVVFQVRLENLGTSKIYNAAVTDNLKLIKALDVNNDQVYAFKTIKKMIATVDDLGSHAGNFKERGCDLLADDIVIMSGGWVQYEMTATVGNHIVGTIENEASVKIRDKLTQSNTVSVTSHKENLDVKYTGTYSHRPNKPSSIMYYIDIKNTGLGYATHYTVINDMRDAKSPFQQSSGLLHSPYKEPLFSDWSIQVADIGSGSRSKLYSEGKLSNKKLEDIIHIAPGEHVLYKIDATLNDGMSLPIESTVDLVSSDEKIQLKKHLSIGNKNQQSRIR